MIGATYFSDAVRDLWAQELVCHQAWPLLLATTMVQSPSLCYLSPLFWGEKDVFHLWPSALVKINVHWSEQEHEASGWFGGMYILAKYCSWFVFFREQCLKNVWHWNYSLVTRFFGGQVTAFRFSLEVGLSQYFWQRGSARGSSYHGHLISCHPCGLNAGWWEQVYPEAEF